MSRSHSFAKYKILPKTFFCVRPPATSCSRFHLYPVLKESYIHIHWLLHIHGLLHIDWLLHTLAATYAVLLKYVEIAQLRRIQNLDQNMFLSKATGNELQPFSSLSYVLQFYDVFEHMYVPNHQDVLGRTLGCTLRQG